MKRLFVFGQLALLAVLPVWGQEEPLTRASQIRDLTPAEAAKGLPVMLHATLTYYNPDWNALFVQDKTGAAFVRAGAVGGGGRHFKAGQILEVTGKTEAGPVHCDVEATGLRVVGEGPLPTPLDLSATNLLTVANERMRVKAEGQVFSIGNIGGSGKGSRS